MNFCKSKKQVSIRKADESAFSPRCRPPLSPGTTMSKRYVKNGNLVYAMSINDLPRKLRCGEALRYDAR